MEFLLSVALLWILSCDAATISTESHICNNEPVPRTCKYENVALRGRATQSSIYVNGDYGYLSMAINAIDGNQDSNFHHGSCSMTNNDYSAWWRVDLLKPYKISHIIITNRGDCCGERLNGGQILIGNSNENNGNNNPSFVTIDHIPNGGARNFQCNNVVGRYVNIILPGKSTYLQICEVQVFGIPADNYCDVYN
ncbi:fucolectin-4-like [Discoglossus pictus]